jgi:hypothetical protein
MNPRPFTAQTQGTIGTQSEIDRADKRKGEREVERERERERERVKEEGGREKGRERERERERERKRREGEREREREEKKAYMWDIGLTERPDRLVWQHVALPEKKQDATTRLFLIPMSHSNANVSISLVCYRLWLCTTMTTNIHAFKEGFRGV